MSDKPMIVHTPLLQTFINRVLALDAQSANRAQNYRKKILTDYIQAELEQANHRSNATTNTQQSRN